MIKRVKMSAVDFLFVVGGGAVALVLFPLVAISVNTLQQLADKAWPPAVMKIHSAEYVTPDTLKLRFDVTRKKPCTVIDMSGYSGPGYEAMQPNVLRKADNTPPKNYPVGITVTSPPWLMGPIAGPRIMVYGTYDCDSRHVTTLVIDEVVSP